MTTTQPLEHRIGVGTRVYHMTSEVSWEIIQEDCLRPCSFPNPYFFTGQDPKYCLPKSIVCSASKDFDEWKEFGLFKDLLYRIGYGKRKSILLSFPLEIIKRILVVDHAHLSPKRFLELGKKNLWKEPPGMSSPREEKDLWREQCSKYALSLIPLERYDQTYQLPEIWVPYAVPLDKITVEGVVE